MSNLELTEIQKEKISQLLVRLKRNVKDFEDNAKYDIGLFKDDVVNNLNNCIFLISNYIELVHRIGTGESIKQQILRLMGSNQIADLYLKAIVQPDWVSVKEPINEKSSEIEEFSPAWITRVQDIFVLFQDKEAGEEIKLFDYLSYNMGEKVNVIEHRKVTFAKFCKLCGLIVDIDKDGWPSRLDNIMIEIKKSNINLWDKNIRLVPFLSLLKHSMDFDSSKTLSYKFSILISLIFIIYYIATYSNPKTCKAMNDIMRSTDTYLDVKHKLHSNLDLFIEIIVTFGRIICIILYGNDDGFFPEEKQLQYKTYRSQITIILLKLTNELFNFTQNGITLIEHPIINIINDLRITLDL